MPGIHQGGRGRKWKAEARTEGVNERGRDIRSDGECSGDVDVSVPAGTFLQSTSKQPARQRDEVHLKVRWLYEECKPSTGTLVCVCVFIVKVPFTFV